MLHRLRRLTHRKPTTRQAVVGAGVVILLAQLVILGFTGQGSPQPIIPERWARRR